VLPAHSSLHPLSEYTTLPLLFAVVSWILVYGTCRNALTLAPHARSHADASKTSNQASYSSQTTRALVQPAGAAALTVLQLTLELAAQHHTTWQRQSSVHAVIQAHLPIAAAPRVPRGRQLGTTKGWFGSPMHGHARACGISAPPCPQELNIRLFDYITHASAADAGAGWQAKHLNCCFAPRQPQPLTECKARPSKQRRRPRPVR
jgi:hypothetical protein